MKRDKPASITNVNQAVSKRLEYLADKQFYKDTGILEMVSTKPKRKRRSRKNAKPE